MTNFTKDAIKQTFIDHLRCKPLSQITVTEIVSACNINRNTFYYHYRDLPALVEDIMNDEADRLITEFPTLKSIEDCLNAVLAFANKNEKVILHICNSMNRPIFEKYLWKICRRLVETYWNAYPRLATKDGKDLIIEYYTCTCFGLALHWLTSPSHITKSDIHFICQTLNLSHFPDFA